MVPTETIFEEVGHLAASVVLCDVSVMSSTRCRISAKQLERELDVTYKTAWRMGDLIRKKLMIQGTEPVESGKRQLHILAALAEFERERIRERIHAEIARPRRKGNDSGVDHTESGMMTLLAPRTCRRTKPRR